MLTQQPFRTYFILSFLSIIVGTLSHEWGHYISARASGYDSKISYGSTRFGEAYESKYLDPIFEKYIEEIKQNKDFPGKEEYLERSKKFERDHLLVVCAGPLITLLMSVIAFLFLLKYQSSILIFLSLFSLRFPLVLGLSVFSFYTKGNYYSDELTIAFYLGMPTWSISILMGVIGLIVPLWVYLKIIPKENRGKLILALALGGMLGVTIWFYWLGKFMLPL